MSSSAQSSPIRVGSVYGKSGLVSTAKSTLAEQTSRLQNKHNIDVDIVDDLRSFIKTKSNIEKDYCNQMIKLVNSQSNRKYPTLEAENDSQTISLYTSWKTYLEELDKSSKNRLAQFDQLTQICDLLKQIKTRKVQIAKKSIDQHLKKMHEEVLTSVAEIDKTRKLYFEDEHMAKQARDKDEKIKKQKSGIFSSLSKLQTKKDKCSAQREASDIQSTQARNDYLMALAAGNAHLDHYYSLDLPQLIVNIDDTVLDKCKGFMLSLLESEINAIQLTNESLDKAYRLINSSSADFTNKAFMAEQQSACLRELLVYDFERCDNDNIDIISLDYNADIALRNEVQKWFTWFSKDCRNLNRLSQQLIKCQSLLAEGHKTVEVPNQSNPVDIENRIDDIKQQIRKCEISKLKAKARLDIIKNAGLEIEDYESFEAQVTTEVKQQSLSLDVDIGIGVPLSRTPSLRSTNISTYSDGGRISSLDGNRSDDQQTDTDHYQTPEPDLTSGRSGRPESSSSDQLESPDREYKYSTSSDQQKYSTSSFDAQQSQGWTDYDPTQPAWEDEPPAQEVNEDYDNNVETVDESNKQYNASYDYTPLEGPLLVGKTCQTLYQYEAQTQDELSFVENENIIVLEAIDNDWVNGQNDRYMVGYVPAAYLMPIGDAPQELMPSTEPIEVINDNNDIVIESTNELQLSTDATQRTQSADSFVKAIYGYTATSEEEMSFSEGDILKLLSKSEDGWWTAEKDGIIGHFPSMLVEELNEDRDSGAFAESGESGESDVSIGSPTTPLAPPPSFAPPKPAYLTPHQVVIIQPTPDVESKPSLGDKIEENEENITELNEELQEEANEDNVEINVNTEFILEKPIPRIIEETCGPNIDYDAEDEDNDIQIDTNDDNFDNNSDESEEQTSIVAIDRAVVNVEAIEVTAGEISEAITMEAIQAANQYNHDINDYNITLNNEVNHQNYCNEDSDYLDEEDNK
ncbi:protein nervous wreck-like [Oppia nitens]|uniref:protein nervous wreck-like n=1 Tax=Oppia nitens TaxID=1686743 RepID=UPI0023DCE203|nr:protein nervous wreck-like [Oppia nitens]